MINLPKNERNAEIAEAYKCGETAFSLAVKYQISTERVYQVLRKRKVIGVELIRERNAKIVEMYKRGDSVCDIATDLSIAAAIVYGAIRKFGGARDIKYSAETETAKRCTRCGEVKPLGEFPKSDMKRKGRREWCKVCYNAYARNHRANKKATHGEVANDRN